MITTMMTIEDEPGRGSSDCVSRRSLLRIGALSLGAVPLANLLHGSSETSPSFKSVINIQLEGGAPQMDTFDMKPDGPPEVRGEFRPIPTRVPGTFVCELLPRLARLADKYTIIRSVFGNVDAHNFDTTQLGYPGLRMKNAAMQSIGGAPAVGSVISKLLGPQGGLPPFVWDKTGGSQEIVQHGYVGALHKPFLPRQNRGNFRLNIPAERLRDRVSLSRSLDKLKRGLKTSGEMKAMNAFNRQAVEVLAAGKLGIALDLSREDPKVRERYSAGAGPYRAQSERFLLARRLVEAGVRYVGLNWGGYLGFDTHKSNYPGMRRILPPLDWTLSALIEDLYQRGLDRDVLVIVWGEFGRTPTINKDAGRDHWPAVQTALIIGGGLQMGGIIGATDQRASVPTTRPVHIHEILSTAYHHLGIDVKNTLLTDTAGQPRYLLDVRNPIRELL